MKMIVGLGNPGRDFDYTRHNIGFEVLDALSESFSIPMKKNKFQGVFGKGTVEGEEVVLLKPLTYMNLSGESVRPLMQFFKIQVEDLIVVYDDLDLPAGKIRLRTKGSAGGHNGIKSIINHIHTQEFKRLRIGIGRPDGPQPVVDYVLQRFSDEQELEVQEAINKAKKACKTWMKQPFDQVMNQFNR